MSPATGWSCAKVRAGPGFSRTSTGSRRRGCASRTLWSCSSCAGLWEEEVQNGDIQPHASVLLTLNAAYDAYQETVSRARRPALKVGEFRDVLLSLERRAIVRLGPEDDQAQDRELTIRALVSEVAGDDFLTSLEQLLQRPDVVEDDADEEPAAPEADRAEVEVSA
jgi:hypothetical protein